MCHHFSNVTYNTPFATGCCVYGGDGGIRTRVLRSILYPSTSFNDVFIAKRYSLVND